MEDMRNEIANYIETMGYDKDEFLQNPRDEEVEMFFMGCQGCECGVDADSAHCMECGDYHPDHYDQEDAIQEEFGRIQAIYNNFMQALPAYEREQERLTLALVDERKGQTNHNEWLALRTALNKGFGSKRRTRHKRKRKRKRTRQRRKRKQTKRSRRKLKRSRKKR